MDNMIKLAFVAMATSLLLGMAGHLAWVAHRGYTATAEVAEANRYDMTRPYQIGGEHYHFKHLLETE